MITTSQYNTYESESESETETETSSHVNVPFPNIENDCDYSQPQPVIHIRFGKFSYYVLYDWYRCTYLIKGRFNRNNNFKYVYFQTMTSFDVAKFIKMFEPTETVTVHFYSCSCLPYDVYDITHDELYDMYESDGLMLYGPSITTNSINRLSQLIRLTKNVFN
ncbi:hypothetical protein OAA60_01820 [Porticoccaceae bacterium]|jgi:hypothetical protein|nr:hypothetical protein [Porticoccaceae bacterium]